MEIITIETPALGDRSYVLTDGTTAAVIDPQRDVDQYIAFAAEHALKIKHVFLTHLHADFIAGQLELRDRYKDLKGPVPPVYRKP